MNFLIFLVSFSLMVYAQEDLDLALKASLKNEQDYNAITERERKNLEEAENKVLAKKNEFMRYQETYSNFDGVKQKTLEEINQEIKKKKSGKKARYFKCMRDNIESKGQTDHRRCVSLHSLTFEPEDLKKIDSWNASLEKSRDQIKSLMDDLPREIDRLEGMLPTYKANLRSAEIREEGVKSGTKILRLRMKEQEMLPRYSQFVSCNDSTPVINLEDKTPFPGASFEGPFANVPRDNQDGLGTCFANATKNLIVGLSQGKDVASFTDIALQYKISNGTLTTSGLDGGLSCSALNEINRTGLCPQAYSPLENGDRNLIGETLFNQGPTDYLAYNVNLLKNFVSGLDQFKKNGASEEILSKSSLIIEKIKSNPHIVIPLPVARFNIPDEWKIREAYGLNKSKINMSEAEFLKEYRDEYRKFYPQYVKALIEGKNLDQIFELYKTGMSSFIEKYNLTNSLPEYKRVYLIDASKEFNDPLFKKKLRESLDFLKDILGLTGEGDEKVIEYCNTTGYSEMKFLSSFRPLLEELKKNKLNSEHLFDKSGKFKSAEELMQLAVAPACLNPQMRKKLSYSYSCNDGYGTISDIKKLNKSYDEKVKAMREKVVLSLVQGYPLGNSYSTGPSSAHINTIVGLRFNKQTRACEYLIRESQTGRSDWQSEARIYEKISALTEVRRE